MIESLRKTLLASLGLVSFTKEKLSQTIDELVEHGEISREQGMKLFDTLMRRAEDENRQIVDRVTREVEKFLAKGPLATRSELQAVIDRLDALERRAAATDSPGATRPPVD